MVVIGRIAGQYAKPRSNAYEIIENGIMQLYIEKIKVYRGEIVNSFSPTDREPDPERMYQAYEKSIETM
jgi:3-deoxy-7-phosphoheptulonate synthase